MGWDNIRTETSNEVEFCVFFLAFLPGYQTSPPLTVCMLTWTPPARDGADIRGCGTKSTTRELILAYRWQRG